MVRTFDIYAEVYALAMTLSRYALLPTNHEAWGDGINIHGTMQPLLNKRLPRDESDSRLAPTERIAINEALSTYLYR